MKDFSWPEATSEQAYPIAKAGFGFIFAAGFVTLVFALLGFKILSILGLLATFFICYFFRDPDRLVPNQKDAIVSPADGKVIITDIVENAPYLNQKCYKISIFMSVFNVHVNRIPFTGKVADVTYHPGKFFSANLDKASDDNEKNAITLDLENGKQICFVQIAGLIARRIKCFINPGDPVEKGHRFGLICFGSRLDVYLPTDFKMNVKVGDKVSAGTSIIGFIQ